MFGRNNPAALDALDAVEEAAQDAEDVARTLELWQEEHLHTLYRLDHVNRPWRYYGVKVRGDECGIRLRYDDREAVHKYGQWRIPGAWHNEWVWVVELPPPPAPDRDYDDLVWFLETPPELPTLEELTWRARKWTVPVAAVLALVEAVCQWGPIGWGVAALVLLVGWMAGRSIARRRYRHQPEPRLFLAYREDVEGLVTKEGGTQQ